MASEAMNFNSVINYIAYKTGLPSSVVQSWYSNVTEEKKHRALNIRSVCLLLDRMMVVGFYKHATIIDDYRICSKNTFINLYNQAMSGFTWNIITSTSDMVYGRLIASLSNTNEVVLDKMVSGGGGGSGGAKTNFDGYGYLTTGQGGKGGDSYFVILDYGTSTPRTLEQVAGVNGGASQTAEKGVRDGGNGSWGTAGRSQSFRYGYSPKPGQYILLVPGCGGGGSGSSIIRVTKNNSYSVYGQNAQDCYASNGVQTGNYNPRCAAGGGAGGCGFKLVLQYTQTGYDPTVTPAYAASYMAGTAGQPSNSGNNDAQAGGPPTPFPNNRKVGTVSTGGSGGYSGTSGGAAGLTAGGAGGAGLTTGANGYASGGGGGASGCITLDAKAGYYNII